jgi:Arc/MetJ-type ribon-helix-helix transcriptional regulator
MMENIDRLLASGFYLRVSDYLIDLIRKDLDERGIEIK